MVLLFPILEKQQQQQTLSLSSPLHLCINSQKNSMPLLLRPREWSPSRCLTSPLRWNGSCQGHRSYCAVTESVSPPQASPCLIDAQRLTADATFPETPAPLQLFIFLCWPLRCCSSSVTDVRPALLREDFSPILAPSPLYLSQVLPR